MELSPRAHRFIDDRPWLIMAVMVVTSVIVAICLINLDHALDLNPGPDRSWLYGGTADSALSLLSTVAGSAITVAGVIFSATFVTMQLASSSYTPRVVQALSRRWILQAVMGAFLGNFAYSIMVL